MSSESAQSFNYLRSLPPRSGGEFFFEKSIFVDPDGAYVEVSTINNTMGCETMVFLYNESTVLYKERHDVTDDLAAHHARIAAAFRRGEKP